MKFFKPIKKMHYQRFNPRLVWVGSALDAIYPLVAGFERTWVGKEPTIKDPLRILLLESHLIGDTVLMTPLIHALKLRFPEAEIHLLGNPWARDILGPLGLITSFISQKIPWATHDYSYKNLKAFIGCLKRLRETPFDLAIEPRGDARNVVVLWATGAKRRLGLGWTGATKYLTEVAPSPPWDAHLLDAKFSVLRPLGISGEPLAPTLMVDPAMRKSLPEILRPLRQRAGDRPLVGFHPGGSQIERCLDKEQQMTLLRSLWDEGYFPVILGSPAEKKALSLMMQTYGGQGAVFGEPLPMAMAFLQQVDGFLGMDSGPAHIAAALGTRTLVLVEPIKAGITTPRGPNSVWYPLKIDRPLTPAHYSEIMNSLKALMSRP